MSTITQSDIFMDTGPRHRRWITRLPLRVTRLAGTGGLLSTTLGAAAERGQHNAADLLSTPVDNPVNNLWDAPRDGVDKRGNAM